GMRKLLFLACGITLLLVVFSKIAVIYGQTQNAVDSLNSLKIGLCNDRPCVAGVIPGVTQWADIGKYLDNYQLRIIGGTAGFQIGDTMRGTVDSTADHRQIRSIYLFFDASSAPKIASLITLFGPPCTVSPWTKPTYLTLNYPHVW